MMIIQTFSGSHLFLRYFLQFYNDLISPYNESPIDINITLPAGYLKTWPLIVKAHVIITRTID